MKRAKPKKRTKPVRTVLISVAESRADFVARLAKCDADTFGLVSDAVDVIESVGIVDVRYYASALLSYVAKRHPWLLPRAAARVENIFTSRKAGIA